MHIAITRRKFDFSHLQDAEGRIPREDLITSMFFGTLQYLPAAEIVRFLATALQTPTVPEKVRGVLVQLENVPEPQMKFDFWPNLAAGSQDGESSRIEPDVVIKFWQHKVSRENEPFLRIMLECKWDSSQSGDDQLWRQWNALSEVQQQRTLHVYLVKDASEGWEELSASAVVQRTSNQSQVWMQRAVVVTWAQLIRPEVLRLAGPLTGWLEDMSKLLSKLGILPFHGFGAIAREPQAPLPPILFWHRFHGFDQIGLQAVSQSAPVFYQT